MATNLTARQAFLILNALPNIGPITLNRLLEVFGGDPAAVLSGEEARLKSVRGVGAAIVKTLRDWRGHFNLERETTLLEKAGADFLTVADGDYPAILRRISDPPIGLYRKGGYALDRPAVAVVGSRRTTLYGQSVARALGRDLARAGFCVISGLARGIDTEAHAGALEAEGKTMAVLGCGLDIIYPPENLDLYREITAKGAILSEFAFGRRADRQSFPMRNRIVSGMCDAVVVVESDVNGGSMITARFAGEQGRTVFAVPGRIDQASSRGCHQLIRDGAVLCRGVEDILEELNYLSGLRPSDQNADTEETTVPGPPLSGDEEAVLSHLGNGEALDMDRLAGLTGKPPSELMALLMMMELKRLVVKRLDGCYEARRR